MYILTREGLGQGSKSDTESLVRVQIAPREPKKLTEPAIKVVRKLYSLPRSKRIAYVRRLRRKRDLYQAIVTAVREGVLLKGAVLPIAIDMGSVSPWGRTREGKAAMSHLAKMYADYKVQFGRVNDIGHSITVPANEAGTRNGRGSPSTVTLSEALFNTPEGLAALVAHEALHAYRMAKGIEKHSLLDSETDAAMAGAAVWASFGKDKYLSANPVISEIDETSKQFDPANPGDDSKMRTHVAAEYPYGYAQTRDPRSLEKGAAMIDGLLRGSDAKAARILRSASDAQIKRMMSAYYDFNRHPNTRKTVTSDRSYGLLSNEMNTRGLWRPE